MNKFNKILYIGFVVISIQIACSESQVRIINNVAQLDRPLNLGPRGDRDSLSQYYFFDLISDARRQNRPYEFVKINSGINAQFYDKESFEALGLTFGNRDPNTRLLIRLIKNFRLSLRQLDQIIQGATRFDINSYLQNLIKKAPTNFFALMQLLLIVKKAHQATGASFNEDIKNEILKNAYRTAINTISVLERKRDPLGKLILQHLHMSLQDLKYQSQRI